MIKSEKDGVIYKGSSEKPMQRVVKHNQGLNTSTKSRVPWNLIYLKEYNKQSLALAEEKRLKRCNKTYLEWLAKQPGNIVLDPAALSPSL